MNLAFDMSSFGWNGLLAGKDKEGFDVLLDEKKVHVNTAPYGYENVMNSMLGAMKAAGATPHQCILVFEGQNSKRRRLNIDSNYKGKRDARPPEAYVEFQKMLGMIEQAWLDVGALSARQDAAEGDDTLAYLAKHTERDLMIATHDNDMAALVGTNEYGAKVHVWIDGKVNHNKYGDFPFHLITVYKALVGDTSDNIPGCPGFGEKTWAGFHLVYGDEGLQYLLDLMTAGSLGPLFAQAEEDKVIGLICKQADRTVQSFKLASLHPEWVNTRSLRLKLKPGMVKPYVKGVTDDRLERYAGKSWLVTRANWADRRDFCLAQFQRSPFVALDIETSTPPESDEWLQNQVPPDPEGVDVLGSTLTGLSLTFGDNLQHTVYISVDHAETDNVSSEEVRQLVAEIKPEKVIQNLSFELTVLYQEWSEKQEDNGADGFLTNCLDTKMEASYVDENLKNGLKFRSQHHLGYKQQTFKETCSITGPEDELRKGGRLVRVDKPAAYYDANDVEIDEEEALAIDAAGGVASFVPATVTRVYKMNELPATHVFGYGCDDTICTAGLHVYYRTVMELEHTWQCYLETELDAAYMSAAGFLQGTDFSAAKMRELMAEDDKVYDGAWATFRDYLITKGWEGATCPTFDVKATPSDWKLAYHLVTGKVLDSQARKTEKLAALIEAEGEDTLAALIMGCYKLPSYHEEGGEMTAPWKALNGYVKSHFKGEPKFNGGSPQQKARLMYEVMGLPIRIRNKPTDQMKAAGVREGSPKTDVLAIDWALKFDAKDEDKAALNAMKLMQMVETRRSLFYNKYPGLLHWKTGKLHSSLNQCEANTRRSSESGPNKQQLPKHPKIEGHNPRFREVIVPHHADAVIVSLDESSQELRIIADYSKDPAMVACYVGDSKKDMHSLTGLGIAKWKYPKHEWSYEIFEAARGDKDHPLNRAAKDARVYGKKVNFTTEYGAMAKKVAETLLITLEDAEVFVAAKESAFPVAAAWKDSVIQEASNQGFVRTMGGAVRHLQDALNSGDGYVASKAERQAVNFKVQGSAAEQTKRAYGAAWKRRLIFKYDCVFIGPIHDEVVWSVAIKDLLPFLQEMHACMVQPYAGMAIPIESSISFGPSFGEQIEIGDQPTAEAVAEGLKQLEELLAKLKQKAAPAAVPA